MNTRANLAGAPVMPALRYRDAATAIDWVCRAFGFEKHLVVPAEDGTIAYAQLTFGSSMIMIGSVGNFGFGRLMRQPDEIGGAETQSCYLRVEDADAHLARAKAAGADIILDLADYEHGGRGYSCRDLEGHIWTFGTYDPWHGHPSAGAGNGSSRRATGRYAMLLGALSAVAIVGAAAAGVMYGKAREPLRQLDSANAVRSASATGTEAAREMLSQERSAREAAERFAKEAAEKYAVARAAREAAEQAALKALDQRQRDRSAREGAELAVREINDRLAAELRARQAAEAAATEARAQLASMAAAQAEAERFVQTAGDMLSADCRSRAAVDQAVMGAAELQAAETVQRPAASPGKVSDAQQTASAAMAAQLKQARDQLARERGAREAAERTARQAQEQLAQAKAAGKSGGRYDSLTTALLCQQQ